MIASALLIALVLALVTALLGGGLLLWHNSYFRQDVYLGMLIGGVFSAVVFGAIFDEAGPYLAGQGDALTFARAWTAQHRPGGTATCMSRDTDNDKYVTCTVGWRAKPEEPETIETLRCGVNRWYHGWNVVGCQPLIPTRGAVIYNQSTRYTNTGGR